MDSLVLVMMIKFGGIVFSLIEMIVLGIVTGSWWWLMLIGAWGGGGW